jgi:hypothetical protein
MYMVDSCRSHTPFLFVFSFFFYGGFAFPLFLLLYSPHELLMLLYSHTLSLVGIKCTKLRNHNELLSIGKVHQKEDGASKAKMRLYLRWSCSCGVSSQKDAWASRCRRHCCCWRLRKLVVDGRITKYQDSNKLANTKMRAVLKKLWPEFVMLTGDSGQVDRKLCRPETPVSRHRRLRSQVPVRPVHRDLGGKLGQKSSNPWGNG